MILKFEKKRFLTKISYGMLKKVLVVGDSGRSRKRNDVVQIAKKNSYAIQELERLHWYERL